VAKAPALPRGFELPLKQRLPRIGSIDQVAVEQRAAELAKRSIKKDSKIWALELALRCCDLTTLASVATYFPSGQAPLDVKVRDVEDAVAMGADEIDMVIDRGAFLSGRYAKVFNEIVKVKEACGEAHLKVILEVAELGTYDNVRRASLLAMAAGGDFIKTSTGKLPGAATLPVQLVMLEAIRDVYDETGRKVGMKPAGGIRTSKNAIQYLVQVHETLGADWLTPDLYRIGASSLVNDILMQLRTQKTGRYQSKDYFTND
jgi:deoxyribose-phosphate aldolase